MTLCLLFEKIIRHSHGNDSASVKDLSFCINPICTCVGIGVTLSCVQTDWNLIACIYSWGMMKT